MIIIVITVITVIYLLTLPSGIGLGDSGTLAAAAANWGIPHPPGFPSWILLAHWFTYLPWGTVAQKLALVSVFASVGTLALVMRMAGVVPALLLAFSYGFWSQAVNVETYALTNFIIVLLSYLVWQEKPNGWLIGVILGFGLGLNPIVVAVIPCLVYKSYKNYKYYKNYIWMGLVALTCAIAIYSYLPLRASQHPFLNWSDPSTPGRLLSHLTGGGLNIVSSTSINGFTGSLFWYADAWSRFLYLFSVQFIGIGWPLLALGVVELWQKNRKKLVYWLLLVFANVSLAGLYTSGNRDSWFITSFIVGAVMMGEGVWFLYNRYNGYNNYKCYILAAATFVPLVVWFPTMWQRARTDMTGQYIADLYKDVPNNAILVGGGETFNSLTLYAHEALKLRPDVIPVDMTIFYGQPWYRENGGNRGDWRNEGVELPKFTDEMEFSRILEEFADANASRPIFVTGYLLTQPVYGGTMTPAYVPQKYQLAQQGIVYRLVPMGKIGMIGAIGPIREKFSWYLESNYQKAIGLIQMEYGLAFEKKGDYLLRRGRTDEAFSWFRKAGEVAPAYFDQNRLGQKIQMLNAASPSAVPSEIQSPH